MVMNLNCGECCKAQGDHKVAEQVQAVFDAERALLASQALWVIDLGAIKAMLSSMHCYSPCWP